MVMSFIAWGSRSTRIKPPTCRRYITWYWNEYTSPWVNSTTMRSRSRRPLQIATSWISYWCLSLLAAIQLYLWLLDLLGEESYNELSAATTGPVKVYGNLYSWRGHRCTNPGNEKKVDMNNPLSPQLIEHQKDHDIWSWKSCLGTGNNVAVAC